MDENTSGNRLADHPSTGRGRRPRSRRRRALAIGGATAATLTVGAVAFGAVSALHLQENIDTVDLSANRADGEAAEAPSYDGAFDVLLVGSDQREGQGEQFGESDFGAGHLNDVTMLLRVSADHERATVVSIPRDLLVDMPDCVEPESGGEVTGGQDVQFNTALQRGGLPCVASAVESLTGTQIRYAAEISFTGVVAMSTAVGGVPVCFAGPVDDDRSGLHIPAAGTYDLEGDQALAFLRTRHGVGDGSDLGRISAQQAFLSSLARTLQSGGTLTNPLKLYSFAEAATKNMTMSSDLASIPTMVSMARVLADIPLEEMQFVMYPILPAGNRVVPDEDAARELLDRIASDQPVVKDPGAVGRATVVETTDAPTGELDAPEVSTAPGGGAAELSNVVGQDATQQTCVIPF